MTSSYSLFRSLIIYSIVLPVALIVGYLLASTTFDLESFIGLVVIISLMTVPMFLRWHYPWLLFTWNLAAIVFFIPGKPAIGQLLIMISFGISVLQYILNREMKFISVPQIARPLLFILAVVLLTARLTGGIGLNALGGSGDNVGGKRYIALILAVVGFFALTALKIPPQKRRLYVFLYFVSTLSMIMMNVALFIAPGFSFLFLIFPTDEAGISALSQGGPAGGASGIVRLGGLSNSSLAVISIMLAFYGIRGIIETRKNWRMAVLSIACVATLFGGYRSHVILMLLTLGTLFYLEGLTKSRLLPMLILSFVLAVSILVPFTDRLPLGVQRSLAFLPLKLDPVAVENAQASTDWRLDMWASVLPQVPQYLILGKGLGISMHDLDFERARMTRGEATGAGSAMAGDYHNGPLSLIIPFGLFGVAGFIWFLAASVKVLYRNYKFGDADLLNFNRFFLCQFIVKIIVFFFIFGSFYGDLVGFVGIVGISIALNHGVAKPAPVTRPAFNRYTRLAKVKITDVNPDPARG